jgi:hypothetical protein
VKSIDGIANMGNDVYRVTCGVTVMDENSTFISAEFQAVRGADWKIQARTAIAQIVLAQLGVPLELLILPSLETL